MLNEKERKKRIEKLLNNIDINVLPHELKENINRLINQYLKDREDLVFDIIYWQIRSNLNYFEIEKNISKNLANTIRSELKCLF